MYHLLAKKLSGNTPVAFDNCASCSLGFLGRKTLISLVKPQHGANELSLFLRQDEALLEVINFPLFMCNLSDAFTAKKVMALHFELSLGDGSMTNNPSSLNTECFERPT